MLQDYKTYATFVCALQTRFPSIEKSQVNCFTTKYNTGIARGVIYFANKVLLNFFEHINFNLGKITWYSYEVWQEIKSSTIMIPKNIPTIQLWLAPTHTTSISHPISSTIVFLRQG